jgi:hypothetical protein
MSLRAKQDFGTLNFGGAVYLADANGNVTVPQRVADEMMRTGAFEEANVVEMAQLPESGILGDQRFDSDADAVKVNTRRGVRLLAAYAPAATFGLPWEPLAAERIWDNDTLVAAIPLAYEGMQAYAVQLGYPVWFVNSVWKTSAGVAVTELEAH